MPRSPPTRRTSPRRRRAAPTPRRVSPCRSRPADPRRSIPRPMAPSTSRSRPRAPVPGRRRGRPVQRSRTHSPRRRTRAPDPALRAPRTTHPPHPRPAPPHPTGPRPARRHPAVPPPRTTSPSAPPPGRPPRSRRRFPTSRARRATSPAGSSSCCAPRGPRSSPPWRRSVVSPGPSPCAGHPSRTRTARCGSRSRATATSSTSPASRRTSAPPSRPSWAWTAPWKPCAPETHRAAPGARNPEARAPVQPPPPAGRTGPPTGRTGRVHPALRVPRVAAARQEECRPHGHPPAEAPAISPTTSASPRDSVSTAAVARRIGTPLRRGPPPLPRRTTSPSRPGPSPPSRSQVPPRRRARAPAPPPTRPTWPTLLTPRLCPAPRGAKIPRRSAPGGSTVGPSGVRPSRPTLSARNLLTTGIPQIPPRWPHSRTCRDPLRGSRLRESPQRR